jgi:putative transposase
VSRFKATNPNEPWKLKGKSAIHVARHFLKRERNYAGQHLWARGFYVDTVGRGTELIRKYIQEQESEDRRLEQMEMSELSTK